MRVRAEKASKYVYVDLGVTLNNAEDYRTGYIEPLTLTLNLTLFRSSVSHSPLA